MPNLQLFSKAILVSAAVFAASLAIGQDEPEPSDTPFEDPFASEDDPFSSEDEIFGTTDWDSVFAAVDQDFAKAAGGPFEPLLDFRYSKVEGFHLGAGVALGPVLDRRFRTELRFAYDLARERPTGSGLVRYGLLDQESFWVEAEIHDGARPFGSHQPYGNTLLALIGGYDAQNYLREQGGHARLLWKPLHTVTTRIGFARRLQSSLEAKATWSLFGHDRWMAYNETAERVGVNAIEIFLSRGPRYSEDVYLPGIYFELDTAIHGGNLLGADREFTVAHASVRKVHLPRGGSDDFYVLLDAAVSAGRPPRQSLVDIGGHGGLRAFEPRSFVGTQRLFARTQYTWHKDIFRMTRIPVIEQARLKLVPFAEIGAVWGRHPVLEVSDLTSPKANDSHWDLGIGLRRNVDSSGLLSYVEVDFAWPMGADSGPVRATVLLSSRGFD